MITKTITKGKFLIARPSLLDSIFNRSVIFISEHNQEGSIGFILNKPIKQTVKDLLPNLDCDYTVYEGGPVEDNNLYYLHCRPDLIKNSIKITDNIYWAGDFEDVAEVINNKTIESKKINFRK